MILLEDVAYLLLNLLRKNSNCMQVCLAEGLFEFEEVHVLSHSNLDIERELLVLFQQDLARLLFKVES